MSKRRKKKKKATSLLAKGRLHELLYSEENTESDVYLKQFREVVKKAGLQGEDVVKEAEIRAKTEICKRIEEMARGKREVKREDLFFRIMEFLQESRSLREITDKFPEEKTQETLDFLKFCEYVKENEIYSLTGKGRKILALLKQQ